LKRPDRFRGPTRRYCEHFLSEKSGKGVRPVIQVKNMWVYDRLCDLVVRVAGYRFRGPGSIPGAIRFSEK
jgi:hypothetical protein